MPVSRGYGGYTPTYSPSYYSLYSPSSYSSYRASGASSNSRASTPSRTLGATGSTSSVLAEADRRRENRNYGYSQVAAPAAYKYFARTDYYNTTAIYNRSMSGGYSNSRSKELKTIKTEDIDVEQNKETQREHAIPGTIKRDTAANIAGGKQVIRLVTTKQKVNPYTKASGQTAQPQNDLTLGQKLALKHLLVDPKEKASTTEEESIEEDRNSESDWSDWTWETCSESEQDDDDKAKSTKTDIKDTTKVSGSKVVSNAEKEQPKLQNGDNATPYISKWSSYKTEPSKPLIAPITEKSEPVKTEHHRVSFLQTPQVMQKKLTPQSSSSSSSSPYSTPRFAKVYSGAGSKTLQLFDSDADSEEDHVPALNRGWRRGQPPRSDVVVKITKKDTPVQEVKFATTSAETSRVANKILSSPVPQLTLPKPALTKPVVVDKEKEHASIKPKRVVVLPPLKYATQETSKNVPTEETKTLPETEPVTLATISSYSLYTSNVHNRAVVSEEVTAEEPLAKVAQDIAINCDSEDDLNLGDSDSEEGDVTIIRDCKTNLSASERTAHNVNSAEQQPTKVMLPIQTVEQPFNPFITPKLKHIKTKPLPELPTAQTASERKVSIDLEHAEPLHIVPNEPSNVTVKMDMEVLVKAKEQYVELKEEMRCDKKKPMKERKDENSNLTKEEPKDPVVEVAPVHPPREKRKKQKIKSPEDILNEPSKGDNKKKVVKEKAAKNKKEDKKENKKPETAPETIVVATPPKPVAKKEHDPKLDDAIIASQLSRIPSPVRKLFEMKSKTAAGETFVPEVPAEKPKYWNNQPKSDNSNNPFLELTKLRTEVKKQKEILKAEQNALLQTTENDPEEVWYKDESIDFQEQLKSYEARPSDHHRPADDRRTPAENMAIIKLYGGTQFPGTPLDMTPKSILREGAGPCTPVIQHKSNRSSMCNYNEPPVKSRPPFRKYAVADFTFLKVLGKGSFGKVLLCELKDGTQSYYAAKCLKKDLVLEDDDIECTMIERKVLALGCKHPFLCHLFCTFQTDSHLFFIMEYLNGGDLMFHIQQSGKFELERARFYSAEILLALKFLHKKGIVYRDLKLDNVLLDYEGHLRLADFGMCKLQIYLDRTTDTFCGTPDYMAPEIIKGLKYTYCVDWWSFGVLLYEMLIGQSPFNGCDEDELFWSICNEAAYFPKFLTTETKQLLALLLEKDATKRLGVKGCAHGDVCDQRFFKNINFEAIERKQIIPPFRPSLRNVLDVSYFDNAFTEDEALLTPVEDEFIKGMNQEQFKGFSYTDPNYTVPG